jgi:uncharacterized HAD superfamily protein
MDDVLCHTARGCLAIIEREFGKRIPFEALNTFDLGQACDLRPEQIAELFRIVHEPDELLMLKPMDEAVSVLTQWIAAGYEIAIVTGRPPSTHDVSLEWLRRYDVPYHSFIVVDKYRRFSTENTTAISLAELVKYRFCWAVEDSPVMAEHLAKTMKVAVALLNRPWNRIGVEHPMITRYEDWLEIAAALPNGLIR